jgi:hypothetical protein
LAPPADPRARSFCRQLDLDAISGFNFTTPAKVLGSQGLVVVKLKW